MSVFPIGSVGHHLMRMRGVWHDHVEIFALDGTPLDEDSWAGAKGSAPFDNLVYIDFDGVHYRQTNVTFRGRPLHVRSFVGELREGVLHFAKLGPDDPGHVGISGGQDVLLYVASRVTDAMSRYSEPDFIHLIGQAQRTRTTVLYRDGVAVRTLLATGYKLTADASRRVAFDPRGAEGDVHDRQSETLVFKHNDDGTQ
jgi:hypothetical protein